MQEREDIENNRPPWDAVQTFYIEGQPQFFERTMEQVMQAEYHLNRNFVLRGEAMLNEFFDFLDLPNTEEGSHVGWNQYDGETYYGYQWIDFNHRRNRKYQRTAEGRKQLAAFQSKHIPLWRRVTNGSLAMEGYQAQMRVARTLKGGHQA